MLSEISHAQEQKIVQVFLDMDPVGKTHHISRRGKELLEKRKETWGKAERVG